MICKNHLKLIRQRKFILKGYRFIALMKKQTYEDPKPVVSKDG